MRTKNATIDKMYEDTYMIVNLIYREFAYSDKGDDQTMDFM